MSCGKSKFSTTPKLEYKSVNTKDLFPEGSIVFRLGYTDAEGDLQDSILIQKVGLSPALCPQSGFNAYWILPEFPVVKDSEGEIIISYTYGTTGPYPPIQRQCQDIDDTCYFRFVIQDKAKHKSDTVSSDVIIIRK